MATLLVAKGFMAYLFLQGIKLARRDEFYLMDS
jgi:hypothetical protein